MLKTGLIHSSSQFQVNKVLSPILSHINMKPGLEISLNPQAGSVKSALTRLYKFEVENGTANSARREALKRWVEDYSRTYTVDEMWDVGSGRQFGPTPDHRQARRQVERRFETSPLAVSRPEERPWGTPPRRPPSPEDTDPSLPTTKASREEATSHTYLHSYFDHIQGVGSFSRAKKADLNPQMHTPGPGEYHYDEKRFRSQSPRVVIAKAAKGPATTEAQASPGPGAYSPNLRLVHR